MQSRRPASHFFGSRRGARYDGTSGAPSDDNLSDSPSLFSWASIVDHLAKHDNGEINDYADDIDSLLVFGALFSAILTAFIAQTYQALQSGGLNTTNQLLALSLLHATGAVLPDTVYPVLIAQANISPTPPQPSASDRWINILFFLSLLFSLAAALFGILAKQWLREYMKWTSPLAAPRENVLVRQIRTEAWEAWRVASIIASIPILLELAMFLFLAGVITLLWTLDDVVAQVVTVFAAVFTGIIAAFTVSPIFSKRCPYRSPTAWALLAATRAAYVVCSPVWWTAVLCITFAVETLGYAILVFFDPHASPDYEWSTDICKKHLCSSHLFHSFVKGVMPSAWRERDLDCIYSSTIRLGPWYRTDGMHIDLHEKAKSQLINEKARFSSEREKTKHELSQSASLDQAAETLLINIASTYRLARALAEVRHSSGNARVIASVDQCTPFIHSDSLQGFGESEWDDQIRMLTDWCLLTSIRDYDRRPDTPYLGLISRDDFRWESDVQVSEEGQLSILCRRDPTVDSATPSSASFLVPSVAKLFMADLRQLSASNLVTPPSESAAPFTRPSELLSSLPNHRPARQRALELFSSLFVLSDILEDTDMRASFRDAIAQTGSKDNPLLVSNISPDVFMIAVNAHVEIGVSADRSALVFKGEGVMAASDFALLLDYFVEKLEGDPNRYLDLVILTSFYWLRSGGASVLRFSAVTHVLNKMIAAVRTIIARTHPGSPIFQSRRDILLISELSSRSYALTVLHGHRFRRLLHALSVAFQRDLLVGQQDKIHACLHDAFVIAHSEKPCELDSCPWSLHICTRFSGTCPLLSKDGDLPVEPRSPITPRPPASQWSPVSPWSQGSVRSPASSRTPGSHPPRDMTGSASMRRLDGVSDMMLPPAAQQGDDSHPVDTAEGHTTSLFVPEAAHARLSTSHTPLSLLQSPQHPFTLTRSRLPPHSYMPTPESPFMDTVPVSPEPLLGLTSPALEPMPSTASWNDDDGGASVGESVRYAANLFGEDGEAKAAKGRHARGAIGLDTGSRKTPEGAYDETGEEDQSSSVHLTLWRSAVANIK